MAVTPEEIICGLNLVGPKSGLQFGLDIFSFNPSYSPERTVARFSRSFELAAFS